MNRRIYLGIGLIAMSTLMLELILTRIFSVILWYHFAFMAISIALLGMSVSGIYVYLLAPVRSPESTVRRLAVSSFAFCVSTVLALLVVLHVKFVPSFSPVSFLLLSQIYLTVAVPFFFGGLCISLALSQFASNVSKLYFADLVGAGIGCFMVIPVLFTVSGPGAILALSVLPALAALIFASAAKWRRMYGASIALIVILGLLGAINSKADFLKISFVKGHAETPIVLERWNPFSRIVVQDVPVHAPFRGWSPSTAYQGRYPKTLTISIDAHAATPIYRFAGDFESVKSLEYDATSLAYHLKHGGRALIIGPGGGKDVLTALLLGMNSVQGVELNPSIVEIVREDYGRFSGHLYDRDDVHIAVDEGRSYIARSNENFDVIQASLVDSWAATAAGAFVLTENNVYTLEAFEQYYKHLTDDGILTMSRVFPFEGGQTLRLISLAYEAWKANGVEDPKKHMAVVRSEMIGTLLMKKSEFTTEEINKLDDICQRMGFDIVASPMGSPHPVVSALFESGGNKSFYENLPYNLRPPVDDKPFFFHMLRLKDLLRSSLWSKGMRFSGTDVFVGNIGLAGLAYNDNAVFVLGSLMVIVTVLSLLFIFGPLWALRQEALRKSRGKWALMLYFTCLGVGFMMVEVPLMQKLMLFLGHPIYALAVTLFGLLIFSGIGSYATGFFAEGSTVRWLRVVLILVSALLITYILSLPFFIQRLIAIPNYVKVPLVVVAMFPIGFLMGMPFPLGIKLANSQAREMIPWVWGINGATSVFASVFAIAVAITWGFSVAMAVGAAAYILAAAVVFLTALRLRRS